MTYGKGVFWRNIDVGQYDFHPSDLRTCPTAKYDFRRLPYKSEMFHIVVFDPPYIHNPGRLYCEGNYRNSETTGGLNHVGIMRLYGEGMKEGHRILKPGGLLLVKCMDEIESGRQRWTHIEIREIARRLNMVAQDLFILIRQHPPLIQWRQKHARKNHSYMWVFEKRNTK